MCVGNIELWVMFVFVYLKYYASSKIIIALIPIDLHGLENTDTRKEYSILIIFQSKIKSSLCALIV